MPGLLLLIKTNIAIFNYFSFLYFSNLLLQHAPFGIINYYTNT